jgi:hypothetical protein
VTWTVTDVHGRTATCNQTVTVADTQAPTISIRRLSRTSNVVILSWPVTCTSYVLEQTDDLNSPITWVPVPDPVVVEGAHNTVTRAATPSPRFYRLRRL